MDAQDCGKGARREGCALCESVYGTFWKRQNEGHTDISEHQGPGSGREDQVEHEGVWGGDATL